MSSILELLRASTVDPATNSVKLASGFDPALYNEARECLKMCGAEFDTLTQTHAFRFGAASDCLRAVIEKLETPSELDHLPSFQSRLAGVFVTEGKYEIWLGDTIIGVVLHVKGNWRARRNTEQIAMGEHRINMVRAVLGAAKIDLESENITAIQWSDGDLEPLIAPAVGEIAQPESNLVHLEPSSSTEEIAQVDDSRPAAPEAATGTHLIPLEQVIADTSVQSRAQLDMITVAEYAEVLRTGQNLPAIIVFAEGPSYWVADGFHRHAAHLSADRTEINCEVRLGNKRAALLYSAGSNQQHGLRRSNSDKRRAVEIVLRDPEWATWADRAIGLHCGVDGKTVATVRNDLEFAGEIENQPVRKTVKGKEVTAKKTVPTESGPSLGLGPSSEPKASLEHGSTRGDQGKTFKVVTMQRHADRFRLRAETDLGLISWNSAEKAFTYVGRLLSAQSWTGSVLEVLGEFGIVSPDLEINWLDESGKRCEMPSNPIKPVEKETEVRPQWPDLKVPQVPAVPTPTTTAPDLEPVPGLFTHLESLLELGDGAIITITREAGLWLAVSVSPVAAASSKALPFKAITVKGTGLELDTELMTAILPFSPDELEALEAAKPERPTVAIKAAKPAATATKPTPAKPAKKGK